jgi:hypothetical protein
VQRDERAFAAYVASRNGGATSASCGCAERGSRRRRARYLGWFR